MRVLVRTSALVLCVCLPASALAQAPVIDPDHLDFQVAPGDGSSMKANADIKAGTPDLQSDLQLTLGADPTHAGDDLLNRSMAPLASHEGIGFSTSWTGAKGVKLDLSFDDKLDQTWRAVSLGLVNDHQISVDDHSANVGLTLSPFSAVDLNLTGSTGERTVMDVASGDNLVSQSHSQFATTSQSAGAGLKWRPTSWFNLEAKGRMETGDASWRGAPAGGAATGADITYAYFEPSLTGALKTPGQGDVSLTFERAVSPLDEGAFSTFAAVEDRAADARLSPNREWRYRLNYSQKLPGDVQLNAALTQARIESATELGPVGADLQAPISVTGGQRQEANVSMSTPLAFLGLPSFTLNGTGDWKSSQVRDPFTGVLRRASGESPQTATLGLTQSLAGGGARWGLVGRLAADQSLYQMNQVTNVSVGGSLGGFVEYRPGTFALRLQVDGLYGGERNATDLYYEGTRASGSVDHVDHHIDDGQAVRLILSKPL